MSDERVSAVLDDLERLLAAMTDDPEPALISTWHAAFKEAIAGAERGSQWPGIVARAHDLAQRLDLKAKHLTAIRGVIRHELLKRAQGTRALSGYAARRI